LDLLVFVSKNKSSAGHLSTPCVIFDDFDFMLLDRMKNSCRHIFLDYAMDSNYYAAW